MCQGSVVHVQAAWDRDERAGSAEKCLKETGCTCAAAHRAGEGREAAEAQDMHCCHLPPAPVLLSPQRGGRCGRCSGNRPLLRVSRSSLLVWGCAGGDRDRMHSARGGRRRLHSARLRYVLLLLALASAPLVRSGALIEDIPDELVADMKAAHPGMRELLEAAERHLLQANATNATEGGNGTLVPLKTPLVGTSYSCVSRSEYRALAMDPTLGKESRQYSDGTFFCEDYVDYAAACDLLNPKKSCNNAYAARMYKHFETALSVFSCKQYSRIWTCRDCKKAYKRWLCSQIYHKYIIPDTDYVEFGTVSGMSFRCTCPFPNPELEATAKDMEASSNPVCVRICNGMPRKCEIRPGQQKPTCPRPTCGGAGTDASPGLCASSVYLDSTASGTDDFYKGARIEMTSKAKMTGWWADIEEYDGYTRLAMFRKWNKPHGREADPEDVPSKGDTYRIFLKDSMRGMCRNPKKPKVRMGPPCEQQQVFVLGEVVSTGQCHEKSILCGVTYVSAPAAL